MSAPVTHLVIGPGEHGVVRHSELLARCAPAGGAALVPLDDVAGLPGVLDRLGGQVHLGFTDRLLGDGPGPAADAVELIAAGRSLSVTLHDLPQPSDGETSYPRRAEGYRRVARAADLVVVSSEHERRLLAEIGVDDERVAVLPLPLEAVRTPGPPAGGGEGVGVLGFLYPGKGHHEVLAAMAALPAGVPLLALGRPSPGHEDLAGDLVARARDAGRDCRVTGFVPDEDLPEVLARVAVPVVAPAHVSASGSVGTWLSAGRRPVATPNPYVRELAERLPGCVRLVDDLAAGIADALADPASTWLPPGLVPGPGPQEVAARLHALLTGTVAVVVPYYDEPARLERVLAALELQTWPAGRTRVVVADDGSPAPPEPGSRPWPVQVVTQEDRGFRAAAARNLGAAAAMRHDPPPQAVAFLDADMVPEPAYLARTARAVLTGTGLVVGHRRHVDLTGWDGSQVHAWLTGAGPVPAELPEPEWLARGYRESADLRRADERSYRFVISACLTLDAALLGRLGGFEDSFASYGGEDWELAHRAWLAGAQMRHEPRAVAWHDGPDGGARTGERSAQREVKNREVAALAALVPDPALRLPGVRWAIPRIAVELDDTGADPADVALACAHLLVGDDAAIWLRDGAALAAGLWPADDPRVRRGPVPRVVRERCWYRVELTRPVRSERTLAQICDLGPGTHTAGGGTVLTVRTTRGIATGAPVPPRGEADWLHPVRGGAALEAVLGWGAPW